MKSKKVFVFICLLLLIFTLTAATSVNASGIKKEEVENIFIAEQDGYTVYHNQSE